MGTQKGGSKLASKGKKAHKNKPTSTKYKFYSGPDAKRDRKFCPRCGPGIFLAQNKGRLYCGKCHYTEFVDTK